MFKEKKLSIVVPCFNEQEAVPVFYSAAVKVLTRMAADKMISSYEIIFVDDGSTDGTLDEFHTLADQDSNVHYISFSRNFGKEAGIYAGLVKTTGTYVALMDADLQDPPELLPDMLSAITEEGYDCAGSRRSTRKGEPPIRSFFAHCFYKLMSHLTDVQIVDGARDFRLMTRQMADAVISLAERNRFSKGLFMWVGFKTKWFSYENIQRVAGTTKWNFYKLFMYSLDGIVAFSTKPLALASIAGIISLGISFLGILFIIIRKIVMAGNDAVAGWASLVCIMLFINGIQLFCLGIVGQYIAKMYIETKHRPIYLTREEK